MASINKIQNHIRHALNHIYEPEILRASQLRLMLMQGKEQDSPMEFSRLLINAIESLRPSSAIPPDSPAWRTYELLSYRYIQCAKQADLARQFSCSVRQLRREQERAITLLADSLLKQFNLSATDLQKMNNLPVTSESEPSPIEGEYNWLSEPGQSEIINIREEMKVLHSILQPLVQKSGVKIVFSGENGLVRAAIPAAALRQVLLSVLSSLILSLSPKSILIKSIYNKDSAVIQIICDLEENKSPIYQEDMELLDAETLLKLGKGSINISYLPGSQIISILFPMAVLKKVVVVDDNNDVLQLLERYARNTRFHLITCGQPGTAIALIEREQPDLVVLDIMMSSLDGWQLYRQIRDSSFGLRPVIFCTVLAQERLAKTLGADDYIRKPVSRDDFLAALDRQWLKNG